MNINSRKRNYIDGLLTGNLSFMIHVGYGVIHVKYVLEIIGGKSLHSYLLKGKHWSGNQNSVTTSLSYLDVVLVIYSCITIAHTIAA